MMNRVLHTLAFIFLLSSLQNVDRSAKKFYFDPSMNTCRLTEHYATFLADPYGAREHTELALSADQSWLAVATLDELKLYNPQTLELIDRVIFEHEYREVFITWSPTEPKIAVGGRWSNLQTSLPEGNMSVINAETLETIWTGEIAVKDLAWSPLGSEIAVLDASTELSFLNTNSWERTQAYDIYHDFGIVPSFIDWSHDGAVLAITNYLGAPKILVWRTAEPAFFEWLDLDNLGLILWSPTENRLAINNPLSPVVAIWDDTSSEYFEAIYQIDLGNIYSIAWSSDGQMIAVGAFYGVGVWNVESGQAVELAVSASNLPPFIRMAWADDKHLLFSTDFVGNVYAWDVFNNPCPIGVIESEVLREGENP